MAEQPKLGKNATESDTESKKESALARAQRASRESAPEMIRGSISEARRGAKVGRRLGGLVPGVGPAGGAAIGAALYGTREQARVGRETGDPLYAFMTGQAGGGLAGGAINARRAMGIRDEREAQAAAEAGSEAQSTVSGEGKEVPLHVDFDLGDDDATPAEKEEMTARRRRRQRHLGRDRVAASAATEAERENASPASVVTALPAAAVAASGAAEDSKGGPGDGSKTAAGSRRPGFAPKVRGDEHAADAFAKGFLGGMGQVGQQAYLGRRLQDGAARAKERGLPHPEQVAEGFDYTKNDKASWQRSGVAGMDGPSGADQALADRAQRQADQVQPEAKRPSYEPSIAIEPSADEVEREMEG